MVMTSKALSEVSTLTGRVLKCEICVEKTHAMNFPSLTDGKSKTLRWQVFLESS